MISPILVRELRRGDDVVEHFKARTLVDKICSERTLREVRKLLESVGTEGTGAGFFRDTTLYTVAAKTGTAQYADDKIGYRDGYYIGSMVAYFPAHNPRYTVLTTIHTKRQAGKSYYGGPLSGPVVKKVVTYLYNREHDWDLSPEIQGKTLSPANQRRRHRPNPPHRRQILAPHLVRRPQRLGNGTDRLPLERHDLDARTGRPNDAQRRRHGTQRRPVPARKPGPQSFLLGTRLRPIPKHRSRHADLARGSRNHNTQIKR